jgi:hypothetical protein
LTNEQIELLKSNESLREIIKDDELKELLIKINNDPQLLDFSDPRMKTFIETVLDILK